MKRLNYLLILCLISTKAFSQTYDWSWARGSTSPDPLPFAYAASVGTDINENMYITGYYAMNISFGMHNLQYWAGCFFVKYNSNGDLLWVKSDSTTSGSTGSGTYANDLAADKNGNCYVVGSFVDTVYFDTCQLISGDWRGYIVKYDSSGNVIWGVNTSDTLGINFCWGNALDNFGNLFITGNSSGSQHDSVIIAKYDTSGNVKWVVRSGGDSFICQGDAIATDCEGNVYVSGAFDSNYISFGSDTLLNINPSTYDVFITKFDSSGNVLWARSKGSIGNDATWGLSCDFSGNVIMVGSMSSSSENGYVVKYDKMGNVLWNKNFSANSRCYDVTTDRQNNIYVTGIVSGALFIAKYDSSGNVLFTKTAANGGQPWCSIALTKSGAIYLGGGFTNNIFIAGSDILTFTGSGGGSQVFSAKLGFDGVQADFTSNGSNTCDDKLNICGESCVNFKDLSFGNPTSYKWLFPGASPDTSSEQNPQNICYLDTGSFDATLIVAKENFSDTITFSNLITVLPSPVTPSIKQSNDTLYCSTDSSYISFQWYKDSVVINGATNTFYIYSANGNYNVEVKNKYGCTIGAGINVNVGLQNYTFKNISVFPNPFSNNINITIDRIIKDGRIIIYNSLGEDVYLESFDGAQKLITVKLREGIYFMRVTKGNEEWTEKIIRE